MDFDDQIPKKMMSYLSHIFAPDQTALQQNLF
jgi:hypothetical protein